MNWGDCLSFFFLKILKTDRRLKGPLKKYSVDSQNNEGVVDGAPVPFRTQSSECLWETMGQK